MIEHQLDSQRHDLGGGLSVGRLLPQPRCRMVGPFVFLDHMAPLDAAPGIPRQFDVRPHPHIGLATVTYLFDGRITHRDSLGSDQEIFPGEVNWMVAGKGVTHSERFEYVRQHGGVLHGMQAWVALPREVEECDPSFQHYEAGQLPQFEEPGLRGRVIAGQFEGLRSQARVHSPMCYLHLDMRAGSRRGLSGDSMERAVYVVRGAIEVDGQAVPAGRMVILTPGASVMLAALGDAMVMVIGGDPLGERFLYWNFVSSSRERIAQAAADWRAGRMPLPQNDADEFIPLPPDLPGTRPASTQR